MTEYEILRNELIEMYNAITQFTTVMYASCAALFSYAMTMKRPELFLGVYFLVVPLYISIEIKHKQCCHIASYLYVFCENKDTNIFWEHRHHKFEHDAKRDVLQIVPYCALIILFGLFSVYWLMESHEENRYIFAAIILLVALVVSCIMVKTRFQYSKEREAMIRKWMDIKKYEDTGA